MPRTKRIPRLKSPQRKISANQSAMDVKVSIPFCDERQATIVYNSFRVEVEPPRSKVSRTLSVDGSNLVVIFSSSEIRNLRVSVNSFLEHLALVAETIKQFG